MKKILPFTVLISCGLSFTSLACAEQAAVNTQKPNTVESTNLAPHLATRLQWIKFPQPKYDVADLEQQDRSAIVRIHADAQGKVTQASIQESSGLKNLDLELINAVTVAQIKPFKKNGIAMSTVGYQTFSFKAQDVITADQDTQQMCQYTLNSKTWQRQLKNKSVDFEYLEAPQLSLQLQPDAFKPHSIKVKFKVNAQGDVTQAKLKKGTGIPSVDQEIINTILKAQVKVHKTLWLYKKSKLEDQLQLQAEQCP
ncbi:TonB family protein [Acinetobacter calcoaceticus]|uniref:TonB family protein n=1 Tax=Acinetobacter calcoaceticus TaxID=471 RepID=A0A4R1XT32_ACICA|nr:TonB family protein [Acinetobacter calcoaceticus]